MTTAWLEVRDALRSRTIAIDAAMFTLGRDATNHLSLPSIEVSRRHAVIQSEGDRVLLQDCGSRYGTLVNGERIRVQELHPGDRIHLGAAHGADLVFLGLDQSPAREGEAQTTSAAEVHVVRALLDGLRALGIARLIDDVLRLVLDAALDLSGADRGFIMLADPDGRLELKLGRGRGHQPLPTDALTSRKVPQQVFQTGEPFYEQDLQRTDVKRRHEDTCRHGIRSVLCVPLKVMRYLDRPGDSEAAARIGVLYLDGSRTRPFLSESSRSALQALSDEAAVAIENARLYREHCERTRLEQEIEIAADIQRALLPEATLTLPPFALAGTTLPCRSIGGDFYDYEPLPDGRLAFWLGDVAGKGPPAALLSARVQGMLAAWPAGEDVAATVRHVNDALVRRAVRARFVTLFYATLHGDGRLAYCNAGHNPPLVLGAAGVRRLESGGMALGLFGARDYAERVVRLDPGDWLIVFSDGVSDALDADGAEFGEERLLAAVEYLTDTDPQTLVAGVLDRLRRFIGPAPPYDDVTLLAVQYRRT